MFNNIVTNCFSDITIKGQYCLGLLAAFAPLLLLSTVQTAPVTSLFLKTRIALVLKFIEAMFLL